MNKLAKIAMLASALLIPQVASATHAPPSGALSGTDVYVEKGINFLCNVDVNIDSNSDATIALSPGSSNCTLLQFNNDPYAVTMDPNHNANGRHNVIFHDIDVTTITAGDCAGDLTAEWDGTTLWIDTTLPAKTAGPDCLIIGEVQ